VNLAKQVLEKARDQTEAVRGREVAQHRVRLACHIARPCAQRRRDSSIGRRRSVRVRALARGTTARLPALAGDMPQTTDEGDDSSFDRPRPGGVASRALCAGGREGLRAGVESGPT
jgi:hypothetical protein